MSRTNPELEMQATTAGTSVSRRVAHRLHEHIEQAADKGEEMERALVSRGARAHDKALELGTQAKGKARQLNRGVTRIAHDRPWAVVGAAIALGIMIGALLRPR